MPFEPGVPASDEGADVYKVVILYPNGTTEDDDELFESESEAADYGQQLVSNHQAGGAILHMSNPGDHPSDDDEIDFEVREV